VPVAPTAARVLVVSTRVSHHEYTGITRHSRTRVVLTAYFVISLVIGLSCHHPFADLATKLDAGVEASGPHDLAVRTASALVSSAARVHRIPAQRS
jgi:hypothetical protein